ncbi:unnamed protein product [Phaedon cochleariae]|uniref:ribonuclease III n=1 Tax=Phaedon cochleariae TaxID=80249 RepID=A0A9N9SHL7_PHACE|nr:unnamed protein product [Phaedon cochleariae]
MREDFMPRSYQMELMKMGIETNTILFLPKGAGKTFIALLVLKQMSGDLKRSYSEGGKISIIIVTTLALVNKHAKYILDHTTLKVSGYTEEIDSNCWPKDKWKREFDLFQVFVMTSQVLLDLTHQNIIDLKKVNLIVFDKCHQIVNDQHMKELMKYYGDIDGEKPRVLGLTAPLLNGKVKPHMVMDNISFLETTFHSKVATVNDLATVVRYSTNPKEELKTCMDYHLSYTEVIVIKQLTEALTYIESLKLNSTTNVSNLEHVQMVKTDVTLKKLSNAIIDVNSHIKSMGTYGGLKAILAHTIQIERLKLSCSDSNSLALNYIQCILSFVKELLINSMKLYKEQVQIFSYSSDKVLVLLSTLKEYESKEDICCLIFTKRQFTAKVVFYVLDALSKCDPDFSHIKANFMVGHDGDNCNDTRENLFISKKNKEILDSFINKEINVLVASNILEEGIDIPRCTLVIKYDKPEDYREYIQSKGRARHTDSLFNVIVEKNEMEKYEAMYKDFQLVERTLNNYLTGKNDEGRSQLPRHLLLEEAAVTPYYTAGPGSARVDLTSAIPLLGRYCHNLPSDPHTAHDVRWHVMEKRGDISEYRAVVVLPTACPLTEVVEGPFMKTVKQAKKAAALKACVKLHEIGELDEQLLPKKHEFKVEDVSFLFEHYPTSEEISDDDLKTKRLHQKQVASCLRGQIEPESSHFLHVIELCPQFLRHDEDVNSSTMYDAYTSPLCFGIVTRSSLPAICDFPVYVTMGAIDVRCKMNRKKVTFTPDEISLIRTFHFRVFDEVLAVLQPFLMIDNEEDAEMLMLVPMDKATLNIDFELISEKSEVKRWTEPSKEEKMALEVTQETYLRKIVVPWYRTDSPIYVVTEVSLNRSARSQFPNHDYGDFKSYFEEKHYIRIVNPDLPQLLVKALTRRLNFVKPIDATSKKRRDKMYEESIEYLLPELVVKQEFPAPLWIQASLLPTILTRITSLLVIEDLRCKMAEEMHIGEKFPSARQPLRLDETLLNYQPYAEEEHQSEDPPSDSNTSPSGGSEGGNLLSGRPLRPNKDFDKKLLEAQYPWRDEDEPKDIERELTATVMDVAHYEAFMTHPVSRNQRNRNEFPTYKFRKRLALTYPRHYSPCQLRLFEKNVSNGGPELCDLYKALTAAQAEEIVSLERLQMLGNSFLKYVATLYIFLRFPVYDESRINCLKDRLVGSRNLYYLAVKKNLDGVLQFKDLSARDEWLPPGFAVPSAMRTRIDSKELSINALFGLSIPPEEQISGEPSEDTDSYMRSDEYDPEEKEECYHSMGAFLRSQYVSDKHVADVVESMMGAFVDSCGVEGGMKFIEWVGIIPPSENLEKLLKQTPPDPVLNKSASPSDIERYIPNWRELEAILGYEFKNPAYLLQALTHASFASNRTTASYDKLAPVGNAVLDLLLTCHVFETCVGLDPGQVADLRSALVNNSTFAGLLVRNDGHKFLLMANSHLQGLIDKFVRLMEHKNFEVDDEVLILLEEDDNNSAEAVDVPKILGDVFEAIAGAVYFDSNNDMKTIWDVFYKIMWKEIDLFSYNVPKNIVRRLLEWPGVHPKFGSLQPISTKKFMIPLSFLVNGAPKVVHGFGNNKIQARKAAAKLALRYLDLDMSKR